MSFVLKVFKFTFLATLLFYAFFDVGDLENIYFTSARTFFLVTYGIIYIVLGITFIIIKLIAEKAISSEKKKRVLSAEQIEEVTEVLDMHNKIQFVNTLTHIVVIFVGFSTVFILGDILLGSVIVVGELIKYSLYVQISSVCKGFLE